MTAARQPDFTRKHIIPWGVHDWTGASCATTGTPELWYPDNSPTDRAKAQAICADCPIRLTCLQRAIDNHETDGIWGGRWFADRETRRQHGRRVA